MESVVFDGKEYTKASVLASRFRYTQDYLGQLCRGKKVDARLVGRAWYINLESLNGHKTNRYQSVKKEKVKAAVESKEVVVSSAEILPKKPSNYLSRIDVEPILKNKTVKIFKSEKGNITELPMKYESDDYSLIPKLNRGAIYEEIPVNPAGAERLRVHTIKGEHDNSIDFEPEALPEVFLKGSLSVTGLAEPFEEVSAKIEPEIKSERQKGKTNFRSITVRPRKFPARFDMQRPAVTAPVKPVLATDTVPKLPQSNKISIKNMDATPDKEVKVISFGDKVDLKEVISQPIAPVAAAKVTNLSFKPVSVAKQEIRVVAEPEPVNMLIPIGVVLSAFVLAILIAATNIEILASDTTYTDRLVIQTANLSSYQGVLSW